MHSVENIWIKAQPFKMPSLQSRAKSHCYASRFRFSSRHFVLIGWGRSFNNFMSSAPAYRLQHDPKHNKNSLGFLSPGESFDKIYLPFAALDSVNYAQGLNSTIQTVSTCMLYTVYLATTQDINADTGEGFASPQTWNMLRTGYEIFERSIINFLDSTMLVYNSFTQPAPRGATKQIQLTPEGAGSPHPIREGGSGLLS